MIRQYLILVGKQGGLAFGRAQLPILLSKQRRTASTVIGESSGTRGWPFSKLMFELELLRLVKEDIRPTSMRWAPSPKTISPKKTPAPKRLMLPWAAT